MIRKDLKLGNPANELQRLNPADAVGERQYKHHQWLADDFG